MRARALAFWQWLARAWAALRLALASKETRRQVGAARARLAELHAKAMAHHGGEVARKRRMWAADRCGLGFDAPTRALAGSGFFWKRDVAGRQRWRVCRAP